MKKTLLISILTSLLVITSCKDYLTTAPTDFLSPVNYFETEEQLNFASAGVYSILGNGNVYGNITNYLMAWTADEGYMNRYTLTSGPWNYFYSPADSYNSGFWSTLFNGINRANVLLANVDKNPEIPQEFRDKIRGEALFLRGYFYFLLVQYYGGVPVFTSPTTSINDVDVARNSVKEVYEQILDDMTKAESLVPSIAVIKHGGAISKSAVRGILARVNLTMAGFPLNDATRYAEAKKWAKMVMDDTEAAHDLNPDFADIFINLIADQYDTKESIWEVEFRGNLQDGFNVTTSTGFINGPTSPSTSATGRGDAYMSITAKFYNIFEPGDNRKWYSIPHFTYLNTQIIGDKSMVNPPTTEAAKYNIRPGKWRREFETLLPKASNRSPINTPILRFADILLMFAEAENAINGPTLEAVEAVNRVRRRGWSNGINSITLTNPGSGYSSPPNVVISTENGSGAVATATINPDGTVKAVVLNRDQAGITFNSEGKYSSPPTITLTGGGGTGATAVATINAKEDANLKASQYANKEAFLKVIQDERMRELNFEGHRKADLLRWGIFLKVNAEMADQTQFDSPGAGFVNYYKNVSERDLLMPIPTSEISVNQKMAQNPGW